MLYMPWFILLIFHGCREGVPQYWKYFAGTASIFLIGQVVNQFGSVPRKFRDCFRMNSWRTRTKIISVFRKGKVAHLKLENPWRRGEKDGYQAGQYAQLVVPRISFEQHPFTISSSPAEVELTFDIGMEGDWTTQFGELADGGGLDGEEILVAGPFGAPAQNAWSFEHIVLIGMGVGATPCGAIAKSIVLEPLLNCQREASQTEMGSKVVRGCFATRPMTSPKSCCFINEDDGAPQPFDLWMSRHTTLRSFLQFGRSASAAVVFFTVWAAWICLQPAFRRGYEMSCNDYSEMLFIGDVLGLAFTLYIWICAWLDFGSSMGPPAFTFMAILFLCWIIECSLNFWAMKGDNECIENNVLWLFALCIVFVIAWRRTREQMVSGRKFTSTSNIKSAHFIAVAQNVESIKWINEEMLHCIDNVEHKMDNVELDIKMYITRDKQSDIDKYLKELEKEREEASERFANPSEEDETLLQRVPSVQRMALAASVHPGFSRSKSQTDTETDRCDHTRSKSNTFQGKKESGSVFRCKRPNWEEVFYDLKKKLEQTPEAKKMKAAGRILPVGVFYCGSPGPMAQIQAACTTFSTSTGASFFFHAENFGI